MKKRIVLMIVVAMLFAATLCVGVAGTASAEPEPQTAYAFYKQFATDYSLRSLFDDGEVLAANYLGAKMRDFGYVTETQQFYYAETVYENNVQKEFKHVVKNVVAKKAAATQSKKYLVIGTYYGGFLQEEGQNMGEGAEIATGVGLALEIAKRLSTVDLPYNLMIVFFGGYEIGGNYGTSAFFGACNVKTENMLCYINIDSVAAGTYDYVYYDDVPTTQGKYFDKVISGLKANIKSAPTYKKPNSMYQSGTSAEFSHLGNLGLNAFFMDKGVPCVNFIGGNWEEDVGLHRYSNGSVIGTELDTVNEIDKRNGGVAKTAARLDAVASVVVKAATQDDFASKLTKARSDVTGAKLANFTLHAIIICLGAAALILGFVIYYLRLRAARQGLADLPTDSEMYMNGQGESQGGNDSVFEEFSDGNEKSDDSPDDDDDVFRF